MAPSPVNITRSLSRRQFLAASAGVIPNASFVLYARGAGLSAPEPIIDIHQHTNYAGRTDEQLIRHQKIMGATTTVLLPAGRFYGLDAQCGANDSVSVLAKKHPDKFVTFANEVADIEEAPAEIRKFLRR